MPIHEQEIHPLLDYCDTLQTDWSNFQKMVVGTFPIYCISSSQCIEPAGRTERQTWPEKAHFQFFYGSKDNEFWGLFSGSFNEPTPISKQECVDLLNSREIFITDSLYKIERQGYSSLDADLIIIEKNKRLKDYLMLGENIQAIYFTSGEAKKFFCQALGIAYHPVLIEERNMNDRVITMVCLPSPAPTGAKTLPRNDLFRKWLYSSQSCVTDDTWAEYNSFKGLGKLDHFIKLHGLPKKLKLTKEFKKDIYRLAFTEQFEELKAIERVQLPKIVIQ